MRSVRRPHCTTASLVSPEPAAGPEPTHGDSHSHDPQTHRRAPAHVSTRGCGGWVVCDPSTRSHAHDVDAELRCQRCGVRVDGREDGSGATAGRRLDAALPPHIPSLSSPVELHRNKEGNVDYAGWWNMNYRSKTDPSESGNLLCCRSAEHLPRLL
eukprot:GHVU01048634.1.p1 GENE.GHVU01048634.1~~GHVU01048634.1.p1  ORF type:complete len:156 (+),score=2.91 GHVU01048634.1:3-470(+)